MPIKRFFFGLIYFDKNYPYAQNITKGYDRVNFVEQNGGLYGGAHEL